MSQKKQAKTNKTGFARNRSNSVGNLTSVRYMQPQVFDPFTSEFAITSSAPEQNIVHSSDLNDPTNPSKKRNRVKSETTCIICDTIIPEDGENSNSMQCDACKDWVCIGCSKVPAHVYEAINSGGFECLQYHCPPCKKSLPGMNKIHQKLDKLILTNDNRFTSIENKIEQFQTTLDKKINQNRKTTETRFTLIEENMKSIRDSIDKKLENSAVNRELETAQLKSEMKMKLSEYDEQNSRYFLDRETAFKEHIEAEVGREVQKIVPKDMDDVISKRIDQEINSRTKPDQQPTKAMSPGTQRRVEHQTLVSVSTEMKDQNARKGNLVIYGLKEPNSNIREEARTADTNLFCKICETGLGVKIRRDEVSNAV